MRQTSEWCGKERRKEKKSSKTSTSKLCIPYGVGIPAQYIWLRQWAATPAGMIKLIFSKASFGSSLMISWIVNSTTFLNNMGESWKRDKEDDIDHPGSYHESTSWKTKNGQYDDTAVFLSLHRFFIKTCCVPCLQEQVSHVTSHNGGLLALSTMMRIIRR